VVTFACRIAIPVLGFPSSVRLKTKGKEPDARVGEYPGLALFPFLSSTSSIILKSSKVERILHLAHSGPYAFLHVPQVLSPQEQEIKQQRTKYEEVEDVN